MIRGTAAQLARRHFPQSYWELAAFSFNGLSCFLHLLGGGAGNYTCEVGQKVRKSSSNSLRIGAKLWRW